MINLIADPPLVRPLRSQLSWLLLTTAQGFYSGFSVC